MSVKTQNYSSFKGILKDSFFGNKRAYLVLGNPYFQENKWHIDVFIESMVNQVIFVTVVNSKRASDSPKIIIYPINWYANYQIKKAIIDDYEVNLDKGDKTGFRIDLDENTSPEESLNFNLTSRLADNILEKDYSKTINFKIPQNEKLENLFSLSDILRERQTACV